MTQKVDVIVVGLGASGGIIAAELAKAGAKVVALDKGPDYRDQDFVLKHDEIRYYARGSMVPHMDTDPMTWRPDSRSVATLLPWASGPLGLSDPLHLPLIKCMNRSKTNIESNKKGNILDYEVSNCSG